MRRAVRFRSLFCTPQLNMESRDVRVCRKIDSALNATGIGMYLVAYVAPGIDDRLAARIAYTSGVDTVPLSTFSVRRLRRGGLELGYSATTRRAFGLPRSNSAMPFRMWRQDRHAIDFTNEPIHREATHALLFFSSMSGL